MNVVYSAPYQEIMIHKTLKLATNTTNTTYTTNSTVPYFISIWSVYETVDGLYLTYAPNLNLTLN